MLSFVPLFSICTFRSHFPFSHSRLSFPFFVCREWKGERCFIMLQLHHERIHNSKYTPFCIRNRCTFLAIYPLRHFPRVFSLSFFFLAACISILFWTNVSVLFFFCEFILLNDSEKRFLKYRRERDACLSLLLHIRSSLYFFASPPLLLLNPILSDEQFKYSRSHKLPLEQKTVSDCTALNPFSGRSLRLLLLNDRAVNRSQALKLQKKKETHLRGSCIQCFPSVVQ